VKEYLKSKNIEFFPKEHNPANVPDMLLIEDFWAELKSVIYDKNLKAENLDQLHKRFEYSIKKISQKVNISFSKPLSQKTKIDRVGRNGMINL